MQLLAFEIIAATTKTNHPNLDARQGIKNINLSNHQIKRSGFCSPDLFTFMPKLLLLLPIESRVAGAPGGHFPRVGVIVAEGPAEAAQAVGVNRVGVGALRFQLCICFIDAVISHLCVK